MARTTREQDKGSFIHPVQGLASENPPPIDIKSTTLMASVPQKGDEGAERLKEKNRKTEGMQEQQKVHDGEKVFVVFIFFRIHPGRLGC